jgi:hypothetical protein
MLIQNLNVKGSIAMLRPLSRSEKPHEDLWLIGLSHDGRISSLAGFYPILSALGFVPKTRPNEGKWSR